MKDPPSLPCPDINRANRPGTTDAAHDEQILIDNSRRIQPNARRSLDIQISPQVNRSILPKTANRLARFRIERVKMISGAGEKALFTAIFILPEHQPALPAAHRSRPFRFRIP